MHLRQLHCDFSGLKTSLRLLSESLGFDACGVARAGRPPHADAFLQWLREGHAADMQWLERGAEKRVNPDLVLPGARSVVVLAVSYWQGEPPSAAPRIARYAWGEDYHDLILEKLRKVDDFLKEHGGTQKTYVDTGPVLERDFAALAGIGWHGKSTMLIHRRLGTWFFLAVVLTTLDLEPDTPETDHCGNCERCVAACPTAAILPGRKLDARRCLSYWTIENKGPIPEEFRRPLGNRIYGCDDCLDACPWNRFAQTARETRFFMPPELSRMRLRDFLRLSDEQFRVLFRGSAVKRIKLPRLLRNVCVALGNTGTEEDLPALEETEHSIDPMVAEHAAWAAREIRSRNGGGIATPGQNNHGHPRASG